MSERLEAIRRLEAAGVEVRFGNDGAVIDPDVQQQFSASEMDAWRAILARSEQFVGYVEADDRSTPIGALVPPKGTIARHTAELAVRGRQLWRDLKAAF